ncbi:MAG: cation:proton antiporter [Phycisphaerales bacterium]|nr:cation:proton antiporter [Phycisphaerales bacterium]
MLAVSVNADEASAMTWVLMGDVVILLGVAALMGMICERIGLSSIVGAMLAGVLVGPGALNFVGEGDALAAIGTVAEVGVALLLFTIGLEITRSKLKAFGASAALAGILQILITGAVCAGVSMLLGLGLKSGIAIGAIVSLSSTAAVAGLLADRGETESPHGRLSLGILITQDVALVPLVLLVTFMGSSTEGQSVAEALEQVAWALVVVVAAVLIAGLWVLPHLFKRGNTSGNHDLPVVMAVVAGLLAAFFCQQVGLSPALGAFLTGLALADSPFARQIRSDVAVLKAVFLTLFFASIGTLADPGWIAQDSHLWLVLGVALALIVGKALLAATAALLSGATLAAAIGAGLVVAEIGEFSFVLGAVGRDAGLLDKATFQVLTSASLFTLLAVPVLMWAARPTGEAVARWCGREGKTVEAHGTQRSGHVVIVGGGPSGRMALQVLIEHGYEAVVVDMNPRTADILRRMELGAVVGDATRRDLLHEVSLLDSAAVLVTLPDPVSAVRVIENVRSFAADVPIIARGRYNRHSGLLLKAGADVVVNEEDRVGDVLGQEVVNRLGVRPLF